MTGTLLSNVIPLQKTKLESSVKRVIAIDGTARVGKGTLAKELARHFKLLHVDSGAIYRAVTLQVIDTNVPHDCYLGITDLIYNITPEILSSDRIRSHAVSNLVPQIAKIPELRIQVRNFQRKLVDESSRGAVVEGRDIATNVFPDAHVKIFLTAHPRERARRAYDDLRQKGVIISITQLENDILARDHADMNREVDPLVQHPHAFVIDSTSHSINSVLWLACGYVTSRFENF